MDFQKLPVDDILFEISNQPNPDIALQNIIGFAKKALPSEIWETFGKMDLQKDIQEATVWIQQTIDEFPESKGIYLGLDTLNMKNGYGTNVEIGLNSDCDPNITSDEWIFDCKNYRENHLIKGLFSVSDSFANGAKWSDDELSFAEYVIFLGYSGLILREALLNVKTESDFISVWGFHDGDIFYLVNKKDDSHTLIDNVGN